MTSPSTKFELFQVTNTGPNIKPPNEDMYYEFGSFDTHTSALKTARKELHGCRWVVIETKRVIKSRSPEQIAWDMRDVNSPGMEGLGRGAWRQREASSAIKNNCVLMLIPLALLCTACNNKPSKRSKQMTKITSAPRALITASNDEIEAAFQALGYGVSADPEYGEDVCYGPASEMEDFRAARQNWLNPGRVKFGAYCAIYGMDM